ncbi:hypothetical protein VIGAN_06188100 [Vigna angularis var. angularis]|uniref:Uncharacterized protein n=1 Tax=Vigna angularis var. angularis TaxID=157739 RepID=A0A0S3SCM2_PHAAN|nr:hypothetical protein VIGAN_06188100 [Vigna angularis var. angularis]
MGWIPAKALRRSNPLLFPCHVVSQRLPFSDHLLLPCRACLPTLLAARTIFVTDNSPANFSLDHTPFTHPDLFSASSLAGVQSFLDYSLFGDDLPPSPSPPAGNSIDSFWNSDASPPAPVSTASFFSPSSPSFFHCYHAKVFQSLLKGKGKNVGLQICFSFQREVFLEPESSTTAAGNCDGKRK